MIPLNKHLWNMYTELKTTAEESFDPWLVLKPTFHQDCKDPPLSSFCYPSLPYLGKALLYRAGAKVHILVLLLPPMQCSAAPSPKSTHDAAAFLHSALQLITKCGSMRQGTATPPLPPRPPLASSAIIAKVLNDRLHLSIAFRRTPILFWSNSHL